MKTRTALVSIILGLICLFLSSQSLAFFSFDVRKAKKYMSAQMYPQAAELLKKRITDSPTDEEAHFLLAECSLYAGDFNEASKRFSSAINLEPELRKQVAPTCLKVANDIKGISSLNQILLLAEKYATNQEIKQTIAQKQLELSHRCSGKLKKSLMQKAALVLGDGKVYGFEVERLDAKSVKIVFFTEEPVTVLKWYKGLTITFVEVSNPKTVLIGSQKDPNYFGPVPLNLPFKANNTTSLILKGKKGEYLIFKSDNLSSLLHNSP